MSGSISRRRTLGGLATGLGALALGGVLPSALTGRAQAAALIPSQPMTLSRSVERDLKDGKSLVVARSWSVEFERSGRGSAIGGVQKAVDVTAPKRLEPLAQIERDRSTAGMFPILLDENGLILAAGTSYSAADMREAVEQAESILETDTMGAAEASQVHSALLEMAKASERLIETLPADLFFPRQPLFVTRKPIALGGGSTGEFVLRYECESDESTGLMCRAERKITTIIGGQQRFSREIWTLV